MATRGARARRTKNAASSRRRRPAPPSKVNDSWVTTWRELRRLGLVITERPVDPPPENPEFRPIHVEGEPLSETMIRERRSWRRFSSSQVHC